MATRKPKDNKPDDRLPGEAEVACAYREAPKDMPPAELDATILAAAQRAVAKPKARGPFSAHWAVPLSTAAVIVLSLGVLLLLTKQGALNEREDFAAPQAEAPAPLARSAPASPPEPSNSVQPQDKLSKAKPASPLVAQEADARRDQSSSGMESKKMESDMAAPAAAPAIRERIAEERAAPARNSVSTQDKLKKEVTMTAIQADVTAVQVSGPAGAYQFNVTVRSPDLGCKQYADWWEVVSEDGKLLYRRVLLHSHVDEQPFTRSGGPVTIQPDAVVWVRAHMNTGGYGGVAFKGSVKTGFKNTVPEIGFATGLAKQPPLPDGCDF